MNFELLRAIREKGLYQKDIADATDDHQAAISRIVHGHIPPKAKQIKIARFLGCKVSEIFPTAGDKAA